MSAHNFPVNQAASPSVATASEKPVSTPVGDSQAGKPLGRVQLYLIELKTVLVLLREVLVEVKELAVVVALIVFFVWGVIQLFSQLH